MFRHGKATPWSDERPRSSWLSLSPPDELVGSLCRRLLTSAKEQVKNDNDDEPRPAADSGCRLPTSRSPACSMGTSGRPGGDHPPRCLDRVEAATLSHGNATPKGIDDQVFGWTGQTARTGRWAARNSRRNEPVEAASQFQGFMLAYRSSKRRKMRCSTGTEQAWG